MHSQTQRPSFLDDQEIARTARAVLAGTMLSAQDEEFARPRLYVSGPYQGRYVRGELHHLRQYSVTDSGEVLPPPVLMGRVFDVSTDDQGRKTETELTGEGLDLLCLTEAYTIAEDGTVTSASSSLRDVLTSPVYREVLGGQTRFFFHFPNLFFKKDGFYCLKHSIFEQSSLPENPAGGQYVVQAKCAGRPLHVALQRRG